MLNTKRLLERKKAATTSSAILAPSASLDAASQVNGLTSIKADLKRINIGLNKISTDLVAVRQRLFSLKAKNDELTKKLSALKVQIDSAIRKSA